MTELRKFEPSEDNLKSILEHLQSLENHEAEDMCQRLRVAMKVGPLDGQEFYQLGDSTFVAIKWRRRNANAVEFASFGDVSQVMPELKEILSGFDKILFPAVPKSLIGSRSEVLKEMGHKVFETKCYVFVLKDESKLVKEYDLEATARPLTENDLGMVDQMVEAWIYAGPNSANMMRSAISQGFAFGVFVDKEPVAWAIMSGGAIATLHTKPEHRRRGHARHLVSGFARHMKSHGLTPLTYVVQENAASMALFSGLGFEKSHEASWLLNDRDIV